MKIVWDERKRLANLDKHGLDFADIVEFDWSTAVIEVSHSKRMKAIGRFRDGAAAVAYAELAREAISIISFRHAGTKERRSLA